MIAVPKLLTMAKLESVENQETAWPVSTLPAESRTTALKLSVSPTARVALAGCTVTLATDTGAPVTWIVIESANEPLVATMLAEPTALPVTLAVSPAAATSAGERGVRLLVRAPGASSVELAADFTDWHPVVLERVMEEGAWQLLLPVASGLHRLNVRIDGGKWIAPAGTTRSADEFGSEVGIVAVP